MASHPMSGFSGDYLSETGIAEQQLKAMADAIPPERYSWRPTHTARSVSEVFVHIAVGNLLLLDQAGAPAPHEVYGTFEEQGVQRIFAVIAKNEELEKTITQKADVTKLLDLALALGRESFTTTTSEQLAAEATFFGQPTTVRRVYMRLLVHMHEHMGQLIGYVRMMGMNAPWPDPRELMEAHRASVSAA